MATTALPSTVQVRPKSRRQPSANTRQATPKRHFAWLAGGMVIAFLVPYLVADRVGLQRDVYYGVYVAAVLGLFVGWADDTGQ